MKKLFIALLLGYRLLNPLASQNNAVQLEASLTSLADNEVRVDVLNELAWQLRLTDLKNAKDRAEQANVLAKKINYKKGEANSYASLGIFAKLSRDYMTAEQHNQRALQLRKELGNLPDIGRMYNSIGSLYEEQGEVWKAINTFEEGLQLLEKSIIPDHTLQEVKARLHYSLGDSFRKVRENVKALEHLEKSIGFRKETSNYQGLAESYLSAGICYYQDEISDIAKSGDYLLKSLALFEKLADVPNQAKCLLNIGNLYFHQQKSGIANTYYDRALETGKLDSTDSLRIFRKKSNLLFQEKKFGKALELYHESLERFKQTGNKAEIASLYSDIGNVYYEKGDYPKTIEHLEKSRELADSLDLFGIKLLSTTSLAMAHEFEMKQKIERKERTLRISFVIFWIILGAAIFYVYSHRKKRQLAEKNAALAMQEVDELLTEQELKTAYARLEGQEDERKRVAQDLHDRIGVMLSTVKLYFSPLDSKLNEIQQENRLQYEKATNLLDEACQEVRRISHDMSSPVLTNLGLEAELNVLASRIEEARSMKVNVLTHGLKERLDGNIEVKLYRIIQELVANTLKHAHATEVNIQLNCFEGMLNVMVEDNGTGFDPAQVRLKGKGMGLGNVASRVNDLHGTFEIDSKPGKGTTVMIDIPLVA
jgi:two-component system, NarL family, sensor kinase